MKKRQTLNALMAVFASLPCMIACTQSYPGMDYDIEEGVQNTETYERNRCISGLFLFRQVEV